MALNPKALGIGFGAAWGLFCAFAALLSLTGLGVGIVYGIGTLYLGYQPGIVGAALGLIYGFIDGFIGGFIMAFVYNMFEK
jgi:hypothetical protein